jgi:hypothetical protein
MSLSRSPLHLFPASSISSPIARFDIALESWTITLRLTNLWENVSTASIVNSSGFNNPSIFSYGGSVKSPTLSPEGQGRGDEAATVIIQDFGN